MVHLGHKTEERAHVSIKKLSDKNLWRAQDLKILCLSSMAALVLFMPLSAQAQVYNSGQQTTSNRAVAQFEIRLQQLETQIRDLTGRVEEQNYTINLLRNQIETLKQAEMSATQPVPSNGASQIAKPVRENPLNLGFEPPALTGIQTTYPAPAAPQPSIDATAQYEAAFSLLRANDYTGAAGGFENFLVNNADHVLAANAKYWLGETFYVRGEYKSAARHFAEGFQKFPNSAKSPDMLLKLGLALKGLNKKDDACIALSQLPVKFPAGHDEIVNRAASEMEKLGCKS